MAGLEQPNDDGKWQANDARLTTHALQFRRILEKCITQLDPMLFRSFPSGSCSTASELLAASYKDEGFGPLELVGGRSERLGCSHAWLEQGNLIIDITADQFGHSPVVTTRNREWYNQFNTDPYRWPDADFRVTGGEYACLTAYSTITKHLVTPPAT